MVRKLICFVLIFFALERFCHSKTAGFQVNKIVSSYDFNYPVSPLPTTYEKLFDKPLTFLGSGVQFYAFETADHQYVVKFIKHNRRRPDSWLGRIRLFGPLEIWRRQEVEAQKKRIASILRSCSLANKVLSQETAVVYAHLNQTPHWNPHITVKDKIGIAHQVPLGMTEFVIQKKAVPYALYMKKHPEKKNQAIEQIASLFRQRATLNIAQLDDHLERNIGFIDDRAIDIDIGSFLEGRTSLQEEMTLLQERLHD